MIMFIFEIMSVSSVSLHVGIMNLLINKSVVNTVSSVSLHVGIMN